MSSDSYAAQLEQKLLNHGCTPAGAAWVMKALHPVQGGAAKMPDASAVNSLNPQFTTTAVIGAPSGLAANTNWDACIISPPSDCIGAYIATNAAGIDFGTSVASYNTVLSHSTTNKVSSSGYLIGAGVTIAGAVWTNGLSSYTGTVSSELPAAFRIVAKSVTGYAAGSALYNQGTVYSAQFASTPMASSVGQCLTTPSGAIPVVNIDDVALPLSESDMAVMTPSYYTTSAVEGFYSVHRLNGPNQQFVSPRGASQWRTSDGSFMVFNISDPTNTNMATGVFPRVLTDAYASVSPVIPPSGGVTSVSTAHHPGLTWGVTIFRGLHPQMTISLKTVTVLELVPSANAPSRQFITPPPEYDPVAMRLYYHLAHEMRPVMASKHNFFGTLLPMLSSLLTRALPVVGPLIGQGLSALGGIVSNRTTPAPARRAIQADQPIPARRAPSVASARSARSVRSVRSTKGKKKVTIRRRK